MKEDKFLNVVISSKNRIISNTTNQSVMVKMLDNIFPNSKDNFYVSLSSFNMIKSFYAAQNGLNTHFQVILKLPNEPIPIEIHDRYISEGNYHIKTFIEEIKSLTNNALFDITYDIKLNKFIYKNLFQPTFEAYIKPITCGIFLGFENGVEYKILPSGTYSSKFINLSGYSQMLIKVDGNLSIENTISNISGNIYEYDKILAILPLQDIQPMDSITYQNEGSSIFKHRVSSLVLPNFNIKIVNKDGKEFPNMSDWIMMLKFEQIQKDDSQLSLLNDILADIRFYIMAFYSYFQIPTKVTFEDLITTNRV
jgi:hypothetical protein